MLAASGATFPSRTTHFGSCKGRVVIMRSLRAVPVRVLRSWQVLGLALTFSVAQTSGACTDALVGGQAWEDKSTYTCAQYRSNSWCANDAVKTNHQGSGAETNCCGCGRPADSTFTACDPASINAAYNTQKKPPTSSQPRAVPIRRPTVRLALSHRMLVIMGAA